MVRLGYLGKCLFEALEASAEGAVPDIVSATDAESAKERGVFFVRGAGGRAVMLLEAGEDARATVGQGSGAFDPDGVFLDGQLDESIEVAENGKVVAGFLVDEKLDDFANALFVDGAVGAVARAKVSLGALA